MQLAWNTVPINRMASNKWEFSSNIFCLVEYLWLFKYYMNYAIGFVLS
jgi:hypothetical protein